MLPTTLFRLAVASFATFTLLPAQSAPVARVQRSADKATATEKMQVRLAEVITMLEEDDLTPEQRAAARKKLEEIVRNLRQRETTTLEAADFAGPTPPRAPSAPKAARAPKPPKPVEVEGFEIAPMVVEVEGGEGEAKVLRLQAKALAKAGEQLRLEGAKFEELRRHLGDLKLEGSEGGHVIRLGEGQVMVVEGGEAASSEGGGAVRWRVVKPDGSEVAEAETVRGGTRWRALTPEGSAEIVIGEAVEEGQAPKLHRVLLEAAKVAKDVEGAKVQIGRLLTDADGKEVRAQVEKARGEAVRALTETTKLRTEAGRQRAERAASPSRRAAEAGEDEIRAMIESMRAEMREIRELMQQLRRKVDDDNHDHDHGDVGVDTTFPSAPAAPSAPVAPAAPSAPMRAARVVRGTAAGR